MKKSNVKINGIEYTVRASTDAGLKDAIRMLKKSLKREVKENKEEE